MNPGEQVMDWMSGEMGIVVRAGALWADILFDDGSVAECVPIRKLRKVVE